jgi:rhamnogalacturonan endolyase
MKSLFIISFILINTCIFGNNDSIIFYDGFNSDLSNWVIEKESDETNITLKDSILEISTPKGITLWFNKKLEGNIKISYYAYVVKDTGKYDRVSDLNCFWMASDPLYPDYFFTRSEWRKGIFSRYYSCKLYYVGYGGNNNTTTRFRKYNGDFDAFSKNKNRPDIIKEYTDSSHLIIPNKWHFIEIIVNNNQIQYYFNNKLLFDYYDENPYNSGYFGIRTTENHLKIKKFVISKL